MCTDSANKPVLAKRPDVRRRGYAQSGFSLIELIVFIIIVSVGVVGILSVMNVTVKSSADPMVRKQAVAMAEAILDEVLSKAYANPPGGYTETDLTNCSGRPQYDDVDDYNCFDGAPSTAVIQGSNTLGASAIPALASYTATVASAPVTVAGVTMKRITVTVTGGPETIQLFGYRANY
jgi:MSHA pilin protein MshD